MEIPEHIAAAVNRLSDYAHDLDLTERPSEDEYDVTADIRLICDAAINAITGHALPPVNSAAMVDPTAGEKPDFNWDGNG